MSKSLSNRRSNRPKLSPEGTQAVERYSDYLHHEQDLSRDTVRNYLSDLTLFAEYCEHTWEEGIEETRSFDPSRVATPTITSYRSYLQTVLTLKAATVNRHLVSIKRYFSWVVDRGLVTRDPARVVKLIPRTPQPPRHLEDSEEAALVAAVTQYGSPRDRALITVALHTGLRAEELCRLNPRDVKLGKRSGSLDVYGKRNKHRVVPLNSTARSVLEEYLATLPKEAPCLFPSQKSEKAKDGEAKTLAPLSERALRYIVAKYARIAGVSDLSPHDLRHRFGYRMAETVPLHRLAQIMGHDSLDTTMIYVKGTKQDLQAAVEEIAWA